MTKNTTSIGTSSHPLTSLEGVSRQFVDLTLLKTGATHPMDQIATDLVDTAIRIAQAAAPAPFQGRAAVALARVRIEQLPQMKVVCRHLHRENPESETHLPEFRRRLAMMEAAIKDALEQVRDEGTQPKQ